MSAPSQAALRTLGVTKRYGQGAGAVTALRETTLSVRPGEFVAVMGPSGSGKSSLMNLVGLLDRPTSGKVMVAGRDTSALSADGRARLRNRHIGFVFQAYNLMPGRTACGNVELPLVYPGAYPAELSGGEQQRVAIARALAGDPGLIVADEPTGALDSAASGNILDLLEAACADGRTVLMVTHDPAVARRADRLIRLRDGQVTADGPVSVGRLAPPETRETCVE